MERNQREQLVSWKETNASPPGPACQTRVGVAAAAPCLGLHASDRRGWSVAQAPGGVQWQCRPGQARVLLRPAQWGPNWPGHHDARDSPDSDSEPPHTAVCNSSSDLESQKRN